MADTQVETKGKGKSEPQASGQQSQVSGKGKRGSQGRVAEFVVERRVAEVKKLLETATRKREIKRFVCKKHNVSARTAESYISRARAQMLADVGESPEFLRAQSLARYREIAGDPNAKNSDRLMAQKLHDKLLGLNVPVPILHANADGEPFEPAPPAAQHVTNVQNVQINMENATSEELRKMREARRMMREATAKITFTPAENVGADD